MASPVFVRDAEVIRDALATPYAVTSTANSTYSGCLYRPDGSRVALSLRPENATFRYRQDNPERTDPAGARNARSLDGKTLYLGHYIPQYGHFLAETLSTFWIFDDRDIAEFDHVAFHVLGHGRTMPAFARYCLETFGIDPGRIVFLDEGMVRFEEVTVPSRLLEMDGGADPSLARVYGRIRDRAFSEAPEDAAATAPRRVYLSRRRLTKSVNNRFIANEVRIESLFSRYGFSVVYPEQHGFADQIRLCGRAEMIAGPAGAALANSLFMPPGGVLVQLLNPRGGVNMNEALADVQYSQAAGHRDVIIPFEGLSLLNNLIMHYDLDHVESRLRDEPGLEPVAGVTENRLRDSLEIGLRDMRTIGLTVSGTARRLARKSKRAVLGGR